MYGEYLTDIEVLCTKAALTNEERDAVLSFAKENCDKIQVTIKEELLKSAFQKMGNNSLLLKFLEYFLTPKSWNTDFDGENGIPY